VAIDAGFTVVMWWLVVVMAISVLGVELGIGSVLSFCGFVVGLFRFGTFIVVFCIG